MTKTYIAVSGIVFGLVALAQATRAFMHVQIQLGAHAVPIWGSWIAAIVAACLCGWAFVSENRALPPGRR